MLILHNNYYLILNKNVQAALGSRDFKYNVYIIIMFIIIELKLLMYIVNVFNYI